MHDSRLAAAGADAQAASAVGKLCEHKYMQAIVCRWDWIHGAAQSWQVLSGGGQGASVACLAACEGEGDGGAVVGGRGVAIGPQVIAVKTPVGPVEGDVGVVVQGEAPCVGGKGAIRVKRGVVTHDQVAPG